MENLHLKNLNRNYIEYIKTTKWFKEFSKEQKYYIESGLKNNINITSFAKKEIQGQEMYEILTNLELEKYNEQITLSFYNWYNFYPDMKIDIDSMLSEIVKKI
jgi:hypothetical protein